MWHGIPFGLPQRWALHEDVHLHSVLSARLQSQLAPAHVVPMYTSDYLSKTYIACFVRVWTVRLGSRHLSADPLGWALSTFPNNLELRGD